MELLHAYNMIKIFIFLSCMLPRKRSSDVSWCECGVDGDVRIRCGMGEHHHDDEGENAHGMTIREKARSREVVMELPGRSGTLYIYIWVVDIKKGNPKNHVSYLGNNIFWNKCFWKCSFFFLFRKLNFFARPTLCTFLWSLVRIRRVLTRMKPHWKNDFVSFHFVDFGF